MGTEIKTNNRRQQHIWLRAWVTLLDEASWWSVLNVRINANQVKEAWWGSDGDKPLCSAQRLLTFHVRAISNYYVTDCGMKVSWCQFRPVDWSWVTEAKGITNAVTSKYILNYLWMHSHTEWFYTSIITLPDPVPNLKRLVYSITGLTRPSRL
jgi:hypothetical protein